MTRPFDGTRVLPVVLAVLLSLLTGAGSTLATPPTPASGSKWAQNQAVDYRWKGGSEPPAWMRGAMNAAAADVKQSSASKTPVFAHDANAASWIAYTSDIPTSYAVGYAIRNVPDSFSIRLRPQGYVLDWGRLRWCQYYDNPPKGCYDAEMITLHEFGHVLTLGHIDESTVTAWTDTIMHASPKTKAKAGWNAHEYGRCDVARLQIRYEPRSASTPISTCLDLGTDLFLSASPSGSVAYGSGVTMTATLRIDSDAVYASLAGDALAGRTVWLQRRAVNGSTWTDLVQLTSQSSNPGRYSRSITVTGTYDYRARFATPSNEGLTGSASAILRIAVGDPCVNSGVMSVGINAPTC